MQKRGCNLKNSLLYCSHITGKGARKMKRTISLMLSLIIILSLVCGAVPSVSAASAMKTSTNAINMIKTFEGFVKWPQMDNGQWTVGYGTGVSGADLENYKTNGITEAQATELLTKYLVSFENSVNSFIDTHNLKLNQHQFDALVSFTYNLGPSWMQGSGTFRSAVINGTTGNDFIYAMCQFGKAGGVVIGGLVERRLCEANLYLNGVYSTQPPVNFKYVVYNGNMEGVVPTVTIQAYDTSKGAAEVKSTVAKSGYRFLGWYTKAEGGNWITSLGLGSADVNTLYAHWQEGDGEKNADGTVKGTAVEYYGYAAAGSAQNVYSAPGGTALTTVKGDQKLKVTAEFVDSANKKWGKIEYATGKFGWINITGGLASSPVYEKPESVIEPLTVTVTTGNVNNRVGPGTNYAKNGTYYKGQQLVLTAIQKGGNYTWGKSEQGWIALQYTDYETSKVQNSEDAKKVTAVGTIIRANTVNVRAGAGTNHAKVGVYHRNDEVKITLRQKVGNIYWGLTEKGWVSLYYVKLTEVDPGTVPDIDLSGATSGGTTGGTTTGGTSTGDGTTVIATGRVYNCNALRIRAAAGTSSAHVGDYASGTYVDIYETTTVRSEVWGRTDKGWISLRYVKLDAPTTGAGVTGRIFRTTSVNLRSGAGTHYPKVGKLAKGTKVEILEYVKVGNGTWGRTPQGWVSLYYVTLDAPLTNLDGVSADGTGTGTESGTGTGTGTGTETPAATKYTITVANATNGKVTASAASAELGAEVTLTVTPDAGYALDTLAVKTASGAVVTVTNGKFTMPEGNVTVTATFKSQFNVKINAATGGKVTANTTACAPETEVILTAAPDAGYELDTLTVVNTATNASVAVSGGKFTMPAADVNVVATFKATTKKTFSVTINGASNGSVVASTTSAKNGDVVTLTVNPSADYVLDTLTVKDAANNTITCTAVSGKANTFTFKMPQDNVTVAATFKAAVYTVSITNSTADKGTVSVNPTEYEKGETVTLIVAPASGQMEVKTLTVKSGDTVIETKKDGANYTFTMPAGDVKVESTFGKIRYALNIAETTGGTVTADKETYAMNEIVTVTIKPSTGYSRGEMIIKAGDTEIVPERDGLVFKFKMPGKAVDVVHNFSKNEYALSITNNSFGAIKADKEKYGYQDTVTLTITPRAGYVLKAIAAKDDGTKIELTKVGDKYTFVMPASSKVVVSATYEMVPVNFKVNNTEGTYVNIRENYKTDSADLGDIPNGTVLEATAESPDGKWVKVTYQSITGWVMVEYLAKVTG